MLHAMTIDVEDYYSVVGRDWLNLERPPSDAVARCTARLLSLFGEHGVKATFFILGEVVEAFPRLVRDIHDAGHEIGVHGHRHQQVFKLTEESFREEVGGCKDRIEQLIGEPVQGHRAPAFSINPETRWALDVLADLGFRYDSSVYPIAGNRYGWPGFPLDIHAMDLPGGGTLIEVPLSTVSFLGKRLPCGGGGYLRLFPYWITRWALGRIARKRPGIVYLHPYEFDTEPGPQDFADAMARADAHTRRFHLRLSMRRRTVLPKLTRLLKTFSFAPLAEVIDQKRVFQIVLTAHDRLVVDMEAKPTVPEQNPDDQPSEG